MWVYVMCSRKEFIPYWEGDHRRDMLFSVPYMKEYLIVCINGDVNLDHLAKVVPARILYCKLVFPFIPNDSIFRGNARGVLTVTFYFPHAFYTY